MTKELEDFLDAYLGTMRADQAAVGKDAVIDTFSVSSLETQIAPAIQAGRADIQQFLDERLERGEIKVVSEDPDGQKIYSTKQTKITKAKTEF